MSTLSSPLFAYRRARERRDARTYRFLYVSLNESGHTRSLRADVPSSSFVPVHQPRARALLRCVMSRGWNLHYYDEIVSVARCFFLSRSYGDEEMNSLCVCVCLFFLFS